jgi:hypothetical protein
MTFYRCAFCRWTTEHTGDTFPGQCPRCLTHESLYEVPDDELAGLVDSGEITYCPACKVTHLGSVKPRGN